VINQGGYYGMDSVSAYCVPTVLVRIPVIPAQRYRACLSIGPAATGPAAAVPGAGFVGPLYIHLDHDAGCIGRYRCGHPGISAQPYCRSLVDAKDDACKCAGRHTYTDRAVDT